MPGRDDNPAVGQAEYISHPERAPFKNIVKAEHARPVAEFWQRELKFGEHPVFDSSVADLRTWEEGGATSTWMNEVGGNLSHKVMGGTGGGMTGDYGQQFWPSTSHSNWTNLTTAQSQAAYAAWETRRQVELLKWETASLPWYEAKAEREAQAEYQAYQEEQSAAYWAAWEADQAAAAAYIATLTDEPAPAALAGLPPSAGVEAPPFAGLPPFAGVEAPSVDELQVQAVQESEQEAIQEAAVAAGGGLLVLLLL
jgi:hypothetical protein